MMRRTLSHRFASGALLLLLPALSFSFFACSSAPKAPDGRWEVRNRAAAFVESGNRYHDEGRYDQALRFYQLALRDQVSVYDREGMTRTYLAIGTAALAMGDEAAAETAFREARSLAKETAAPALLSRSADSLGRLALARGAYPEALEFFREALADDGSGTVPEEDRAVILHNTGVALRELERYDEAFASLSEALALNEAARRHGEIASNRYAIAQIRSRQGRYREAVSELMTALEKDRLVENGVGVAKDILALGLVSRYAGERAEAYDWFRKALLIHRALGMEREIPAILRHLSETAAELGRSEEAAAYAEAAQRTGGTAGGAP